MLGKGVLHCVKSPVQIYTNIPENPETFPTQKSKINNLNMQKNLTFVKASTELFCTGSIDQLVSPFFE